MANKENIQLVIEAIDNFSGVLDKLNKSLEKGDVEIKVKVNETSLTSSINSVISKINGKPPSINLRVDSKEFSKNLKEELSNQNVIVKINPDKFKDSLGSAKKKLIDFVSTIYKVVVEVNKEKFNKSVDSIEAKISKVVGKDRKVNIDTDSRKITTKLQNIAGRLDTISKKGFTIDGDIKTGQIESKIIRLATYINQLNSKDIVPKVDKGISEIVKLSTYMNQLNAKKLNLEVDVDITKAKSGIQAIYMMLQDLKKEKYKIQLDTSDLTNKNAQLKTTVNTLRNLANSLKTIKSKKVSFDFKASSLGQIVKTIRSLNKELTGVKNNIIINIKVNDGDSITKLREISKLLKDIKSNRNININTRTRGYSGGSGSSEYPRGTFFSGVIQFLGRSSKGFGSFMEAISRVSDNMMAMGGTIGKTGAAFAFIGATMFSAITAFNLSYDAVKQFGDILIQVGTAIYKAFKPGIDLFNQRTKAELALGAGARSMATIDGRQITDEESKSVGRQLTNRAIIDAAKSVFNPSELIDAMQGTMPMLFARGMSAEQAYQVTKGVASVAKLGRLAPNQVLQETRDLAQGSITARTSQVANLLGISNEDIEQYKGDADALYAYLMEKFKEYSKALDEYAKTPIGAFEQLEETIAIAGDSIVSKLAQPFVEVFHTITNSLGSFVDEQGHKLDENGQYLDEYGNKLDAVGEVSYQVSEPLQNFAGALEEIIEYLLQSIDELLEYSGVIEDSKTLAEKFVEVMKFLIDAFVVSIKAIKETAQTVINFGKAVEFIAVPVLEFLYRMVNLVRIAITGWQDLLTLIGAGTGGVRPEDAFKRLKENEKLRQDLIAENEKGYASTFSEFLKSHGLVQSVTDGALVTAYKDGRQRAEREARNKSSVSIDLGKVQGKGKSDTKDLEKANKDAIKQSQKELKARLAELKTLLADKLDDLKDILDKNKIAYDEGFIGVEDYFKNKADIERQEAQAKLDEALAERELITNALYDNEEDREKALAENQKTVNKSTKELNKANTKIEGLTRAISENSVMLRNYNNYFKALNKQNQLGKNKVNYSSSPISSATQLGQGESELARLAVDLAVRAKELNGSDLDVGKILGLFFAETTTESGRGTSLNWRENKNPAGFTANSSTPDNMVDWGGGRGPGEGGDYETFVNVSYDDMLNHIIKTWFKWYEEELSSNTSVADMNAGMQGIFHEANFDRSDIYEEGIDYARSHGLYEAVANNLMSASDSLVSASNNLSETTSNLGQTTNIIQGLVGQGDTWDIWGIDQEEIDSMSARGQAMISTIAKMFRDYFGGDTQMLITSGNRGSGEHFGDSIDFDVIKDGVSLILDDESREVIRSLVHSIGAGAADEVTYTEYSTGPHIHANASGKDWAEIVHGYGLGYYGGVDPTKGFIENIGTSVQTEASSSIDESELRKIKKEFRDYVSSLRVAVEERTLDGVSAQIQQIQLKYKEEIRKLEGQWSTSKDQETLKLLDESRELLSKKMAIEVNDAISGSIDKQMDYTLSQIDKIASAGEIDIYRGRVNYGEAISNSLYDINDKYGLGRLLEELQEYENIFIEAKDFTKALDIKNKIDNAKEKLYNLFSGWIEQGQKYWDNAEAIFNATDRFTPTQKEFAEREFNAYRAQREYADRTALGNQLQNRYNAEIKAYKELVKIQKELVKGSNEYLANEKKITEALQDTKRTEALIAENEQLKKIAELTSKMPDYLDDLKKTARDALDNGLTEFLTDGILEAESLGDALRDLAYNILKEIQQISAKWIVKDLMNKLFGRFNTEEEMGQTVPAYLQQGQEIIASITAGTQQIVNAILGNNKLGMPPNYMMMGQQSPSLGVGSYTAPSLGGLGAFSNSWATSPLNPNAQSQAYSFDFSSLGLDNWSNALQESTQNIDFFDTGISNVNDAVSDVTNSLQNNFSDMGGFDAISIAAQQASTTITTSIQTIMSTFEVQFNTASTMLTTALQNLATQIETFSMSMTMVGASKGGVIKLAKGGAVYHNNGLITGPGSSTSDSIPAMLSNGEAVLNAKAVKELGLNFINSVNNGQFAKIKAKLPHFADGGFIGEAYQSTARGMTDFAKNIGSSVTTNNQMNIALVENREEAIEHFMKSPRGQNVLVNFMKGNGRVFSRFTHSG